MLISSLDRMFYNINDDVNITNPNIQRCGTECSLKFNFKENSTSFRICNMAPVMVITNEYLSDTQNSGNVAVRFSNEDYWFQSIIITPPGVQWDRQSLPPEDTSGCSLVIQCINNNKNKHLMIIRRLTTIQTSRDLASNELIDVINNIKSDNFSFTRCPGTAIRSVNINNFIPTNIPYIYYTTNTTNLLNRESVILNSIFFPPILIRPSETNTLSNYLPNDWSIPEGQRVTLNPDTKNLFISNQPPINFLSDGNGEDDNIFIRCQPTDNDGEILVSGQSVAATDEAEMDFNIDILMGDNKNMITGALVGIIIMIAIMKIGEYVLKTTPKLVLGD